LCCGCWSTHWTHSPCTKKIGNAALASHTVAPEGAEGDLGHHHASQVSLVDAAHSEACTKQQSGLWLLRENRIFTLLKAQSCSSGQAVGWPQAYEVVGSLLGHNQARQHGPPPLVGPPGSQAREPHHTTVQSCDAIAPSIVSLRPRLASRSDCMSVCHSSHHVDGAQQSLSTRRSICLGHPWQTLASLARQRRLRT
jgi:hypothetical protein